MLTIIRTKRLDVPGARKSSLSTLDPFNKILPKVLREHEKNILQKTLAKHEYIFKEDDRPDYLWFVKEGHVKLAHYSLEGKSHTVATKGPEGMFGVSAFDQSEYGVYAMAETEATVIAVPNQVFQDIMGQYPDVAKAVIFHISQLLRKAKEMETISVESAEKRLLHALIEMAGEYGTTIPLTRKEIAEIAGVSVETCIRIFSRLKNSGWFSSTHGKIIIKSIEKLKNLIEEL